MRVESVDAIDTPLWDGFVARKAESTLYHAYSWRCVISEVFGTKCHYLAAFDDDGCVRGILPLAHLKSRLFGSFMISLPYFNYGGVLADSPEIGHDLLGAASELARDHGADHVELRHTTDAFPDLPKRLDKVSMVLKLPSDEETLWRGFSGKLRAQIKRPAQEGASVQNGGVELVDDFYRVFAHNMRDLGTPVYPVALFETIARRFAGSVRIFLVRMAGEPVAAGFVVAHRDSLEIPWASSLRRSNPYGVNMLLYWSVLQWAISQGYRSFDYGRSTRDSGTFRFKRQWGAEPVQHYWHYVLSEGKSLPHINPANAKYAFLVRNWQRLPVALANVIGPHVVKNLP